MWLIRVAAVAVLITLSGCSVVPKCNSYVGVAVHPESIDRPEFYGPNPLGFFGYECSHENYTVYLEHISSIPYYEQGGGLNMLAIKRKF